MPLPQIGIVVWELSSLSGMKLSTFEVWKSICVTAVSGSKWLQFTLPEFYDFFQ